MAKKIVVFDPRAEKEISKFPIEVQLKLKVLIKNLEDLGELTEPQAKKLAGRNNLFELRIKERGEWRVLYTYFENNFIVILSAFQKKTWKTAAHEISKAENRAKNQIFNQYI